MRPTREDREATLAIEEKKHNYRTVLWSRRHADNSARGRNGNSGDSETRCGCGGDVLMTRGTAATGALVAVSTLVRHACEMGYLKRITYRVGTKIRGEDILI
ncbi:unnamed protein product [Heligmosomoides polygyrus]|uniref:30S ribosomal protein S8 n=1 Tax=Heligmosomoides polygyrus TaxID=6339 RepID=A0A183GGR6_HELPZ|nr:unnamed protein product [Heligmosomoides polygyrus]